MIILNEVYTATGRMTKQDPCRSLLNYSIC